MPRGAKIEAEAELHQPRLRRVMGPGVLLLFIIGDILGTGVYALIGDVAAEVGGAAWVPFLLAFVIAAITALSYLELVTKYPQAAGAALYTQKAFDKPYSGLGRASGRAAGGSRSSRAAPPREVPRRGRAARAIRRFPVAAPHAASARMPNWAAESG